MFSMTGYFFFGLKVSGRKMTPQMSVLPSRALAVKTSGAFQPAWTRAVMSAVSAVSTTSRPRARRTSITGGRSTRERVSTK